MRNNQDRKTSVGGRTLALIIAAVVVVFGILAWGPGDSTHVASNPGPSGIPGSTAAESAPPPANDPSETTTGSAR